MAEENVSARLFSSVQGSGTRLESHEPRESVSCRNVSAVEAGLSKRSLRVSQGAYFDGRPTLIGRTVHPMDMDMSEVEHNVGLRKSVLITA